MQSSKLEHYLIRCQSGIATLFSTLFVKCTKYNQLLVSAMHNLHLEKCGSLLKFDELNSIHPLALPVVGSFS